MIKVAPSLLSADFANLASEVRKIAGAGADYIHIDVMDGLFVPNITIGIPVVAAIRRIATLPLDVHLMIDRPIRYVPRFLEAGADILTLHVESDSAEHTLQALEMIRSAGKVPGITLKPATPAEALTPFLHLCGLVLVMTVEPGFGGQKIRHDMLPKIAQLRHEIDARGLSCELEVDGGINADTAKLCVANGADVLVTGSKFFRMEDKAAYTAALRGAAL